MRGSPLVRAAAMVAVLLLLIVPLRSFTAARSVAREPQTTAPPAEASVRLEILSTAAPFTFSVTHLGRVIWQGTSATASVATEVRLPFPKAGVDLGFSANWPAGGTAAVKLSVARGDDDATAQTAWGEGSVSEVFTFE